MRGWKDPSTKKSKRNKKSNWTLPCDSLGTRSDPTPSRGNLMKTSWLMGNSTHILFYTIHWVIILVPSRVLTYIVWTPWRFCWKVWIDIFKFCEETNRRRHLSDSVVATVVAKLVIVLAIVSLVYSISYVAQTTEHPICACDTNLWSIMGLQCLLWDSSWCSRSLP